MLPDLLWSHRAVEARMKAILRWTDETRPVFETTPQERRLRFILHYLEAAKLRHRASHGRPKPGILRLMLAARPGNSAR